MNNQNQQPQATDFKKHLPNIVSITRLLGTFSLPFLVDFQRDVDTPFGGFELVPWVWVTVYTILMCTDFLDGQLARRLNAFSDLGAMLDAASDLLLLFMGVVTVFVKFVSLGDRTAPYVAMLVTCTVLRICMLPLSKKFHGKADMLHSLPQKAFAAATYVTVPIWAFLRDIPPWTIYLLFAMGIYGAIDEIVYIVRTKEYNVDYKGHGFEQYEKRQAS
ncbi:MAG: CDP-alcohol phosphatidyltransferase family protein [Oscillospiraceae bacterium]|nr:CDP-alcohol phosphatidyltransferase family protein [Oscillospiraceae bacterium]